MKEEFIRLDWRAVACLLGASSLEMAKDGSSLVLTLPDRQEGDRLKPRRLLVTDNGGEVNLDWLLDSRVPRLAELREGARRLMHGDRRTENAYFGSVAYTAHGFIVGPLTMASRLWDALHGREVHEIDYSDFDRGVR